MVSEVDVAELVSCPHGERCSGCPLLALQYSAQLERKTARVLEALARHRPLDSVTVAPAQGADRRVEYRSRAKLVVGPDASLGLYRAGSHEVEDIPDCRVLSPALRRVASLLRRELRALPAGVVHAVDLREARRGERAEVLLTLVAEPEQKAVNFAALARAWMRAEPTLAGVSLATRRSRTVLGAEPRPLAGASAAWDTIGGVLHLAVPGAFTQAHREQAAWLHARLVAWLTAQLGSLRGARILDVYGGSGAIGLALAKAGAQVTLFESFAPSAKAAAVAAKEQHLELDVRVGDATELLARWDAAPPSAVVVNPPRKGLAPPLRLALGALRPRALAYVSCEPATLGRDLSHLADLGLRAATLEPLDMIPLSESVETFAGLLPGELAPLEVLHEDDDLLVVSKPPHATLTPTRGREPCWLWLVRERAGWKDAVAIAPGDAEASGVACFAARPDGALRARQRVGAITYLALAKGITSKKGVINRPVTHRGRSKPARTRYRRLEVRAGHSVLEVVVEAEQRQQVRRHLAAIGHPIVGDPHPDEDATRRHFWERHGLDRAFLHVRDVWLRQPDSQLECPLPGDLESVLASLLGKSEFSPDLG